MNRNDAVSGSFDVNVDATIEGLRPFTLHGEPYVQVFYSIDDKPDEIHNFQIIETGLPACLSVQEKVRINLVLGVVNEIERRS